MMKTKVISFLGAAALIAAVGAPAFAHGMHGGHEMGLLARAAGISRSDIHSAFKNDANLKSDFQNVRTTRDAMNKCIVSGGSCSNEISAYSGAVEKLTQERMQVWQKLFQNAPNRKQAAATMGQLEQLRTQRRQIIKQALANQGGGGQTQAE